MQPIQTEDLTKFYGDVRGVEDLTFAVEAGEVFGFLGPNGAGKTTAIRTLMGFQAPTRGSATVLGADVTDAAALREARARVGYLPSEPGFDERVTGRRLLEYHGKLRGDVRSDELLERFDPPLDRPVGDYSRGNRQMLAIVLAFMHDPDLLIMDEPTSGLDPLKQEQFHEFVRSERARGKTFFFSSHILSEVRKVCDRVGIIRDGHLVELSTVESLLDRSGKSVRVTLADAVDAAAFDIPGAHDVTVGSGQARAKVGDDTTETATANATETATANATETANATDTDVDERDSTTLSFTYTGAYEPLLRRLLEHDLRDLTIEEAPLEDVFMRFYDDDVDDADGDVDGVETDDDRGECDDPEADDA